MESVHLGNSFFLQDNFTESAKHYKAALEQDPNLLEALLNLGYSYIKQGAFESACEVLDKAILADPNSELAAFRKGQALFYSERFSEALPFFEKAQAHLWARKAASELNKSSLPPGKEPYTWFQSTDQLFVVANVKARSEQEVSVKIQPDFLSLSAKTQQGSDFHFKVQLLRQVVPEQSTYEVKPNKVEVTLKKAEELNWSTLEPQTQESKPSYPSSSRKKKDWSQIDKEIDQELKKEKPEGEEALQELFKQIYANADEETRRAMIKSYQTSGGTVLSTNWSEVSQKDYEGKDKPEPPEGQQWAK